MPEIEVEAGITAEVGSETDAGAAEVEDDAGVGADAGVETDVGVRTEATGVVQVEMVRSVCCVSREADTFSVALGPNGEPS